jgi:threonine dehydrogenase-like Zn-dependent dehydrogenase
MQALWLENGRLYLRDDLSVPLPQAHEALVRVRLAGICTTDLELVKGYYPFSGVPGHEFVGQIAQAPGADDLVGRRVVGEINVACGHCGPCRAGLAKHCRNRQVLGIKQRQGAFAAYLCLPRSNLIPVPDSIADEAAVFAEPLAAALQIEEQVDIAAQHRVLLIGAGKLGLLIAFCLARTGCNLLVAARHSRPQSLLEQFQIAWETEDRLPERAFDIVVEASGTPAGFHLAQRCVRAAGTIVLKSTFKGEVRVNPSVWAVDEITLVGSRCGPLPKALHLLAAGAVDPLPLIEGRHPLPQALRAFEHAAKPGSLKILLEMEGV